jgi:heterodisulfide reductase subunit C
MSKYRTAMGKTVDMAALTAKNEKTRAVGNMKVNARGDTIDAHGRVIRTATAKVNDSYNRTVGNRSAQPVRNKPKTQSAKSNVDLSELNEFEREIEENLEEELEIEKIKAEELKKK